MKLFEQLIVVLAYALAAAFMLWLVIQVAVYVTTN
jgi:hypothetical protein